MYMILPPIPRSVNMNPKVHRETAPHSTSDTNIRRLWLMHQTHVMFYCFSLYNAFEGKKIEVVCARAIKEPFHCDDMDVWSV